MVGDHGSSAETAKTLDTMKKFNARRKFKGKVKGVILANKAGEGGPATQRRIPVLSGPFTLSLGLGRVERVALRVVRRVRQRDLLLERKYSSNILGDGSLTHLVRSVFGPHA